jgi:hypothetical protein
MLGFSPVSAGSQPPGLPLLEQQEKTIPHCVGFSENNK